MQDETGARKAQMREAQKARREACHDASGGLAAKVARFAGDVLALAPGERGAAARPVVSAYMAIGSELDPGPLFGALTARGAQGALPVIEKRGRPLLFRGYSVGDELEEKLWGIREPVESRPVLEPDILLLPLLAFDDAGWRLGYGGGFYDRTLGALRARKPIVAIGLAYDGQRVDAVPHDDYDEPLDFVLTPSGLREFQR